MTSSTADIRLYRNNYNTIKYALNELDSQADFQDDVFLEDGTFSNICVCLFQ
jgi:hypothetical protein